MPSDGSPLSETLPVDNVQDGCTMDEITGAAGVSGGAEISICADATEVQPLRFVTVYDHVPGSSPVTV